MTEAGFAAALDLDLDLVADDTEPCMVVTCDREAVWAGIITTPCGHPQPLCLPHHEMEVPRWNPGDPLFCYMCKRKRQMTEEDAGEFVRWERIKRG